MNILQFVKDHYIDIMTVMVTNLSELEGKFAIYQMYEDCLTVH